MRSILQDWVTQLGLRHQGVLLGAVRGCDNAPKEDPAKRLVRCYRAVVLNAHCGDPAKAGTFIEAVPADELQARFDAFRKNFDHYPIHYVTHLMHAAEIVGYKHPNCATAVAWRGFYHKVCAALHVSPEAEKQLDRRLDADEETFVALAAR